MALLLSDAVGALGMTDASMNQTGIEIKSVYWYETNHHRPDAGVRNVASIIIMFNKCN